MVKTWIKFRSNRSKAKFNLKTQISLSTPRIWLEKCFATIQKIEYPSKISTIKPSSKKTLTKSMYFSTNPIFKKDNIQIKSKSSKIPHFILQISIPNSKTSPISVSQNSKNSNPNLWRRWTFSTISTTLTAVPTLSSWSKWRQSPVR